MAQSQGPPAPHVGSAEPQAGHAAGQCLVSPCKYQAGVVTTLRSKGADPATGLGLVPDPQVLANLEVISHLGQ